MDTASANRNAVIARLVEMPPEQVQRVLRFMAWVRAREESAGLHPKAEEGESVCGRPLRAEL